MQPKHSRSITQGLPPFCAERHSSDDLAKDGIIHAFNGYGDPAPATTIQNLSIVGTEGSIQEPGDPGEPGEQLSHGG
jgi:hypothetical protein